MVWASKVSRLAIGLALLASGCSTPPEKASVLRQPQTAPTRTLSSFTEGLRCMDTMLWQHGKHDIYLTSNGFPDATGRLLGGTKEMLITAISRMSEQSNAFSFVDFEPALDSVNALYWMVGVRPEFRAPSYYVRGAVTQLDENVVADAQSAGISMPYFDFAVSKDQTVSVISVDISVGELVTRRILPGVTTSNSIAVVSSGKGADAGGIIHKAGLSYSISLNQNEGMHQALRTLIELSTIEVLGKLAHVPYWQCLGAEQTSSTYMTEAHDWFDAMSGSERITFAQGVMKAGGYYDGPLDGADSPAVASAIGRYQADHDLIASGRMDFDLYYRMLAAPTVRAPNSASAQAPTPPAPTAAPDVVLSSDRGPQPVYRVGEAVVVRAQSTVDGFLYCYYADAQGAVARIFPNRFQPDAFVPANRQVEIPPGPPHPFNIRMDRGGTKETIACVISPQEVGVGLPDRFKAGDLQPIPQVGLPDMLKAYAALPNTVVKARSMPLTIQPGS
jgi:curli biogenesis system outer membrane secretion channel CsgG/peptidoglycan hydrolase-like protein with peptidoglycan-binding domain